MEWLRASVLQPIQGLASMSKRQVRSRARRCATTAAQGDRLTNRRPQRRVFPHCSHAQVGFQLLSFLLIVSSALVIWKGLALATNSESPIVVVLRYATAPPPRPRSAAAA